MEVTFKNNDQKCFFWCHIRHLNPLKIHPERIKKQDNELVKTLDYEQIEIPKSKKDFNKTEVKTKIYINVFCYKNTLTYPIHISDQAFENSMDFLIISDKIKRNYVYIKDFNKYIFNKTKIKQNKYFCKNCLRCFSSEKILVEHK